MERIDLNDYLNKENVWSQRLLGYENFQKRRDMDQIEKEYNLDKYAKLIVEDFQTVEEYRVKEFEHAGLSDLDYLYISLKEEIFKARLRFAKQINRNFIESKVREYKAEYICELGCGFGYNLSFFNEKTYGGEYSKNAVKIAKKLGIEVYDFNFYNPEDYQIIKNNTTVFTVHSIHQLPNAECFINSLKLHKEKVNFVVNFESCFMEERHSLLGLLRNKYIELNDYNRDLSLLLKNRSDIEIIEYEPDVFGLNPLLPANLFVWRFK